MYTEPCKILRRTLKRGVPDALSFPKIYPISIKRMLHTIVCNE
jgi:hypothetical protein